MGRRYGFLPSEIISQATTFDLVIMDMAMTFEKHVNDSSKEGYVPEVSVEELLKIKERS
tara:strand:- start:403 stop:579 length:177 start_codon:yes stop_codon:yes gene_type:complete